MPEKPKKPTPIKLGPPVPVVLSDEQSADLRRLCKITGVAQRSAIRRLQARIAQPIVSLEQALEALDVQAEIDGLLVDKLTDARERLKAKGASEE